MIFAIKYFKDVGFIGVKNIDRNYKSSAGVSHSFENKVERLGVMAEGLNEFGVAVISTSSSAKIFIALEEKSIQKVGLKLIDQKVLGNTIVFNAEEAYLIESEDAEGTYKFTVKEIKKNQTCVRTELVNEIVPSNRLIQARLDLKKVKDPSMMLDAISDTSNKDPQQNPLRISESLNEIVTTDQLMICPKELILSYRPLCHDLKEIKYQEGKLVLELLSTKKITPFKEFFGG